MGLELTLKLNNTQVTDHTSTVRIADEHPIINWEFDQAGRADVNEYTGVVTDEGEYGQTSYEIRISTSSINIGLNTFVGNRLQTGVVSSQDGFYRYNAIPLQRGETYYGQVRVVDAASRTSDWATFSFLYNSLPSVTNVVISPAIPAVTDNLLLTYTFSDSDGDVESGSVIRWFKDGVYQKQFDNATEIKSQYLQNGEIWMADVYPNDGYEFGERVSSSFVKITKTAVTVSNVKVLPSAPNTDDVLKVDYLISDVLELENVYIRWFVNGKIQSSFDDERFIKPDVSAGDVVRVEVRANDGATYVSSENVTIVDSDFVVTDITIDGRIEPLDVTSVTPAVKWIRYVTFYEGSNIYSVVYDHERENFTIPANLLERGKDYYISIGVGESASITKFTSSHFRVRGSAWEESVSNSTGWTFETLFIIKGTETGAKDYQVIRLSDGSKFAEVRLYANKVTLISGSQMEYLSTSAISGANTLTICGQNDNIKVYLNRSIIIDGEGVLTQTANIRRLEVGSPTEQAFEVHYKYISYAISGYYLPGVSDEYENLQFHTYMEFIDNEVVALNNYTDGDKVFAINPYNENESSTIYSITTSHSKKYGTVNRTFSPISKIRKSPDGKIIVIAHSKGASIVKGYVIPTYDNDLTFIDENGTLDETLPNQSGWELVQNTGFSAVYFNSSGFNIDTTGETL
jgi:hypothetical protein